MWHSFPYWLGIVAGILQIFSSFGSPYIGILIIVSIILAATREKWLLWVIPVRFLATKADVYTTAEKLVGENEHILFCGKLDDKLLTIFTETFKKRSSNNPGRSPAYTMNILNSDPDFYSQSNTEKIENILKMDALSDNFNHKFYFYKQNVNLLIGEAQGKECLLLFFQSLKTDYNGIYIRDGARLKIEDTIIKEACPTVNIIGQLNNVRGVAEKSLEFWTPLKNGWFHPVFPPDEEPEVRKVWRDSLMSWFNSTASNLLSGGGELTITWKIQEWSDRDADRFKEWLNKLKNISKDQKIKVTRYMLVNIEKYKTNTTYRDVVNEIVDTCLPKPLPRPAGEPYQVHFINRNILSSDLDDDFALFILNSGEKVAQDSYTDEKAGVEILKVIFSKDYNFVKKVEEKITRLAIHNSKSSLTDLLS